MNEKQWMQHDFGAFTWKLHKVPLNIHFLKKKNSTCTPVPLQNVPDHVCVEEGAAVFRIET